MSQTNAKGIIQNFYEYFNSLNIKKLASLFTDDVVHRINYGETKLGKDKLIEYINHSIEHYEEHVSDCVLMVGDNERFIAAKIILNGKYIKTDESLIPAKGQTYTITIFNYFEIENNKINNVLCFFDEDNLTKQLKK